MRNHVLTKNAIFQSDFKGSASEGVLQGCQNDYKFHLLTQRASTLECSYEDLFQQLDGASVRTDASTWHLEVYGVHKLGAHRWVQVALAGSPNFDLVVQISRTSAPTDAITAIEAWLEDPDPTRRVLQVS